MAEANLPVPKRVNSVTANRIWREGNRVVLSQANHPIFPGFILPSKPFSEAPDWKLFREGAAPNLFV